MPDRGFSKHTFYISSSELKAHKSFSSDCVLSAVCPCMYNILFVIEVRVIYSNPHAYFDIDADIGYHVNDCYCYTILFFVC